LRESTKIKNKKSAKFQKCTKPDIRANTTTELDSCLEWPERDFLKTIQEEKPHFQICLDFQAETEQCQLEELK
jgi:hypothetical protein